VRPGSIDHVDAGLNRYETDLARVGGDVRSAGQV